MSSDEDLQAIIDAAEAALGYVDGEATQAEYQASEALAIAYYEEAALAVLEPNDPTLPQMRMSLVAAQNNAAVLGDLARTVRVAAISIRAALTGMRLVTGQGLPATQSLSHVQGLRTRIADAQKVAGDALRQLKSIKTARPN